MMKESSQCSVCELCSNPTNHHSDLRPSEHRNTGFSDVLMVLSFTLIETIGCKDSTREKKLNELLKFKLSKSRSQQNPLRINLLKQVPNDKRQKAQINGTL